MLVARRRKCRRNCVTRKKQVWFPFYACECGLIMRNTYEYPTPTIPCEFQPQHSVLVGFQNSAFTSHLFTTPFRFLAIGIFILIMAFRRYLATSNQMAFETASWIDTEAPQVHPVFATPSHFDMQRAEFRQRQSSEYALQFLSFT